MSNLSVFNFKENNVRVISDDNGTPLFVANDVAQALGYVEANRAVRQHCKGGAKHTTLSTDGGNQKLRVIYEPDVYRLIFGSKLESATQFQDWVFEEVLPTIRQTGSFATPTQNLNDKITAEQAGVLFNIVHGRACGNAKQIIEMWGRLKRHFRYSTYHNLKAIHFEDAVAYLENMELKGELPTAQNIPQTPYFLSQQGGREFDARLRSLFDLAGLMASRGDDIAAVFQRQAKDLNKFMAGA